MLYATSKSKLSWDFTIYEDGTPLAEIDVAWIRQRAVLTIGETVGEVYRERTTGAFVLAVDGQVLMRAEETGISDSAFKVLYEEATYHLKARSQNRNTFGLSQNGPVIGTFTTSGIFSRKIEAQLPKKLPLVTRVFLFWLVILAWKRASRAS